MQIKVLSSQALASNREMLPKLERVLHSQSEFSCVQHECLDCMLHAGAEDVLA